MHIFSPSYDLAGSNDLLPWQQKAEEISRSNLLIIISNIFLKFFLLKEVYERDCLQVFGIIIAHSLEYSFKLYK